MDLKQFFGDAGDNAAEILRQAQAKEVTWQKTVDHRLPDGAKAYTGQGTAGLSVTLVGQQDMVEAILLCAPSTPVRLPPEISRQLFVLAEHDNLNL